MYYPHRTMRFDPVFRRVSGLVFDPEINYLSFSSYFCPNI